MTLLTDITFEGMDPRAGIEAVVRREVAQLDPLAGRIVAAHVAVSGSRQVRVELVTTEATLAVERIAAQLTPAATQAAMRSALRALLASLFGLAREWAAGAEHVAARHAAA